MDFDRLKWAFDNVSGLKEAAGNSDVQFGTLDTWLIYKLSGGEKLHITEGSNVSATGLFDIFTSSYIGWVRSGVTFHFFNSSLHFVACYMLYSSSLCWVSAWT